MKNRSQWPDLIRTLAIKMRLPFLKAYYLNRAIRHLDIRAVNYLRQYGTDATPELVKICGVLRPQADLRWLAGLRKGQNEKQISDKIRANFRQFAICSIYLQALRLLMQWGQMPGPEDQKKLREDELYSGSLERYQRLSGG